MEMHVTGAEVDPEFAAMQTVYTTLKALPAESQERVLSYVLSRLEVSLPRSPRLAPSAGGVNGEEGLEDIAAEEAAAPQFNTFAELFDAANPTTNPQRALVSGYWLQVCEGQEVFDSQTANRELANLGHQIGNITSAIDSLKSKKPALALQTRKSGRTQQARKTYKITTAGIRAVEDMIGH